MRQAAQDTEGVAGKKQTAKKMKASLHLGSEEIGYYNMA